MIPLLAWRFLAKSAQPIMFVSAVLILLVVLFAVGSRAGMALSAGVSILAFGWYSMRNVSATVRLFLMFPILIGYAASVNYFLPVSSLDGGRRLTFFANTWSAISDYWTTGSGLGTFPLVYPMYEKASEVLSTYAARAHNEYLQLLLELGVPGITTLIIFFVVIFIKFGKSELAQAAMLSIFTIALHSVLDFPMRTMGVALPMAYLIAVVLSEREPENSSNRIDTPSQM